MEHGLMESVREILAGPTFARNVPVLDELTGTYAARFGVLRLEDELQRALRYRHSLSCFVLEIDALAEINQAHGAARVDRVLQDVGGILRHSVRSTDIVCRLDSSRFLLITPRLDTAAAQALASRILARVNRHRFPVPGGAALALTASIGVACIGTGPADTAGLIRCGLDALQAAQAAGGNRVALG